MTAIPHDDCMVCRYWVERVEAFRARSLQKVEGAFGEEKRARRELAEHLKRTHGKSE